MQHIQDIWITNFHDLWLIDALQYRYTCIIVLSYQYLPHYWFKIEFIKSLTNEWKWKVNASFWSQSQSYKTRLLVQCTYNSELLDLQNNQYEFCNGWDISANWISDKRILFAKSTISLKWNWWQSSNKCIFILWNQQIFSCCGHWLVQKNMGFSWVCTLYFALQFCCDQSYYLWVVCKMQGLLNANIWLTRIIHQLESSQHQMYCTQK